MIIDVKAGQVTPNEMAKLMVYREGDLSTEMERSWFYENEKITEKEWDEIEERVRHHIARVRAYLNIDIILNKGGE